MNVKVKICFLKLKFIKNISRFWNIYKKITNLFIILHFFNLYYSSVHPLVHEQSQASQQFLSTAETSMHSLISVLQKILMTFMNICNGLGGVNEQRFYVLTDTPNYDIDDFFEYF